jgi:hypothetical protein
MGMITSVQGERGHARREFITLLDGTAALPLVRLHLAWRRARAARKADAQQIAQMKAICN